MSTFRESIAKIRELLLDPLEQKPNVKQVFGSALREFKNFTNELSLTGQPWATDEFPLNLGNGDFLIANSAKVGKILFVSGYYNNFYTPVEFTDLSDASPDWWNYNERPFFDDYFSNPFKLAFYRKNGLLYARSAPVYAGYSNLTMTATVGDWSANLDQKQVLSEYHHLPEIRAALNLLPNCEWSDNFDRDESKRRSLAANLAAQEKRVLELFREAKRNITADDVSFRDDDWGDW